MCYVAMLLALLLAAGSPCWVHAADTVITVGGSGTSNTGPFMWKFMSAVESWTSPLIHLAYRSVGSGFGQSDFVNGGAAISGNDFGCGDLALPTAQWDQVAVSGNPALQIPYLINPVSFFHSIPGVPNGDVANALQLDCVTLAGIFTGQITKWSHPSIRALNPSLSASLAEMTIRVVTRTPGSSSTYGISTYMSKACPAAWGDWDIGGTVSQWGTMWTPAVSASNAQQVVEELLGEPYSIGYIESGQGVEAGLKELRIQARGSGRYVYHGAANFSDAFLASVLQIGTLPAPVENWGEWETLMWLDPSAGGGDSGDTWPIVLVTFFYARENVTWLGPEAGGLLKTFMQLVLSDTGATFITELGMVPLPKSLRDYYSAYIGANVTTAVGGPVWQTELGSKDASTLNADYVVSKYRNTYTSYQTFNMEADVAVLQTNAVRGFGYQVHGSGAFAPATAIRLLMQQLTEQSREPIQTSYRAIPGETTDEEFVAYARNVRQYNQFFVGNVPLSSEQWATLRETTPGRRGAVQIPFAAAALGIYHSQILPGFDLRLTACDVARIYARRVTTWNELLPAAERSASTAFPILLLGYPSTHTNLGTMQAYLDKACPSVSVDLVATGQSLSQGIGSSSAWDTILSPELMIELLETTPHAIGFVQSSFVSPGSRLYPVLLEAPTFGGGVTYLAPTADNAANALELLWDQEDSVPIDFSDDWSKVSALALAPTTSSAGSDKPAGYPITQIMFFYLYQNMDEFDASGPLTKALVSFALDTDGQALFSSRGLAPLPLSLRPAAKAALDTIMVDPLLAHWTVEAKDEFSDAGMQQFSLSGNRLTALAGQMQTLTDGIATLTAAASAALPSVIVVAADSDSAPVLLHALDRLDALSSHPLKSVVEYVPGGAAALLSANPPRVQMALLERPLDASEQLALATHSQAAVQVPLFVRPVALSVWMPGDALVTIRLGPCALARILVGEIDRWDHPDIVALLAPGSDKSQLPSGPFEVFAASRTGGDLLAAVAYAAKGCPARSSALNATLLRVRTPADGSTTSAATLFRSAGAMTGLLVASRYAIDSQTAPVQRFLAPMIDSLQHDLVEVQLQAADSSFVDTLSGYSDATRAAPPSLAVMDARYAAMLDAALAKATAASAASRIVWADVASSLISGALPSDMVPATLRGPMYPVVRLDLLAVLADLSSFNASGAAAAAAAQALTSSAFQALLRPDVLYGQDGSLGLAMLGARASSVAAAALGGDALRLRGARWRVVESSEGAAADLVAPTLNTGLALNALYNFGTAKPPVEAATALAVMLEQRWVTLAEVESRANEAYKLAVAAIVLAAVLWGALFFAALAILIFRPRPLRGGGGGSGSAGAGGASGPGVGVRRSAASFDNPVCCLPLSAPMAQPKDEMLLGHGGNDSDNHATLTPVAKTASANGKGSAGLGSGGEDTTAHVKTPVARAGNGNGVRTGPQASPPLPTSTHGGLANAV